jgi:uncharacterized protein YegP (UPF0339 family)
MKRSRLVNPPGVKNTTLASLRADYKADYVLMVSEEYSTTLDLQNANELLKKVSPGEPIRAVREALIFGQQFGYSDVEMRSLANLERVFSGESELLPMGTP